MNIIGYFHGVDPAACLLVDGEVKAYVEEERLIRFKHANDIFPIRSIDYCLQAEGLSIDDIDYFAYGWDAARYTNGGMQEFFKSVNQQYPPDAGTAAWQQRLLGLFSIDRLTATLRRELTKFYGKHDFAPLKFHAHHASHAWTAYVPSGFDEALVFTVDGSGDSACATFWRAAGGELESLHEISIPHSLGWFYAAITEYLGFAAYDGEYKVMGLAAYGNENLEIRKKLRQIVKLTDDRRGYTVNPKYIHHGAHSYSDRFTDELAELIGLPPRQGPVPLEAIHQDIAYEAQYLLEEIVMGMLTTFQQETGLKKLCIAGGVGMNVKMNSRIHKSGLFDEVFPFSIPSDSGTSIGAAMGLYKELTGNAAKPLPHAYLGPGYSDEAIELQIQSCGLAYRTCDDIASETAKLLADGKVVAWVQGRLEGGARALGGRSILADPRNQAARDRVNAAIKFREYWRPFCPSLLEEAAADYLKKPCDAPYMILAFDATDQAKEVCPAVVHVDGTMRAQTVSRATNPRYHDLISRFADITGVPVVMNTSLNIKGEAMVCSPRDALRTYMTTGIDALAIGNCLLEKPVTPLQLEPEDVIR